MILSKKIYSKEISLDGTNLYSFAKNVDLVMDFRSRNITILFPAFLVHHSSFTEVPQQALSLKPWDYMNIDGLDKK